VFGSANIKQKITIRDTVFLVSTEDDALGEEFWLQVNSGLYEPDTIDFLARNLNYETLFIDVGAARGVMSLFASSLTSRVVALEPNPQVFSHLDRNLKLNSKLISNVLILPQALGISNHAEEAKFVNSNHLTPIVFSGSSRELFGKVQFISLEHLLLEYNQERRKVVMKLDIEGAEWSLFSSKRFIQDCVSNKIRILLAVHPGLNRPYANRKNQLAHLFTMGLWRTRNVFQARRFYRNLESVAIIRRTNLNQVTKLLDFIFLITGGCHEFIVDFDLESVKK
jgi:FkbM family methyltransferase